MTSKLPEEEIFHLARNILSSDERNEFVAKRCGGDELLRQRLIAMLDVHQNEQDYLESPDELAPTSCGTPSPSGPTTNVESPGDLIGPFKIREQIGEGGMGVVYVAEQSKPVARKVALKVIKPGMDSKQVVARFEAERQALAMMDHPNIARVLDAGTTDSGRPYFAMDLVRGLPITQYCEKHKLDTRQRLKLLMDVCHAVQHAHQKGVIHRDLKPSNVLVTRMGDRAIPKVIDFGLAKAMGQQLTDNSIYTNLYQLVGTPLYMSPEQAEMSAYDVDTRSDVYSLGVILYELLTGATPIERSRLSSAGYDEIRRIVREEVPPRPSERVSTVAIADESTIDAKRRTELSKAKQHLKGELDWITLKALEKDADRRYQSASDLAEDLQRYRDGDPVEACPPSWGYRAKKTIQKHRMAVLTASLVGIAMITGTITSLIYANQAQRAAIDANDARETAQQESAKAKQMATARDEEAKRAEQSRDRAEKQRDDTLEALNLAMETIDEFFGEIGEEWISEDRQVSQLQERMLKRSAKLLPDIAKRITKINDQQETIANAYEKAADALSRVHDLRNAIENYEMAFQVRKQLIASESSVDPRTKRSHADLALKLGHLYRVTSNAEAAKRMLQMASDQYESLNQAKQIASVDYLTGTSSVGLEQSELLVGELRLDRAIAKLDKIETTLELELHQLQLGGLEGANVLLRTYRLHAKILRLQNKHDEAINLCQLGRLSGILGDRRDERSHVRSLAALRCELGLAHLRLNNNELASTHLRMAEREVRQSFLFDGTPKEQYFSDTGNHLAEPFAYVLYARIQAGIAHLECDSGNPSEAFELLFEAGATCQYEFVNTGMSVPSIASDYFECCLEIEHMSYDQMHQASATDIIQGGLNAMGLLAHGPAATPFQKVQYAKLLKLLARHQLSVSRPDKALNSLQAALALLQKTDKPSVAAPKLEEQVQAIKQDIQRSEQILQREKESFDLTYNLEHSARVQARLKSAHAKARTIRFEPHASALNRVEKLYILDDSHQLTVTDGSGNDRVLLQRGEHGLKGLFSFEFGPDKKLYIADGRSQAIMRFITRSGEPDGNENASLDAPAAVVGPGTAGMLRPRFMAFDREGDLYVSSINIQGTEVETRITKHSLQNPSTGTTPSTIKARDRLIASSRKAMFGRMTFGSEGMLYVVDEKQHTVHRFDPKSNALNASNVSDDSCFLPYGAGGLRMPRALRFMRDMSQSKPHLYVSSSNGEILRFDGSSGEFKGVYADLRTEILDFDFSRTGMLAAGTSVPEVLLLDMTDDSDVVR